jgi:hypothetical protein
MEDERRMAEQRHDALLQQNADLTKRVEQLAEQIRRSLAAG